MVREAQVSSVLKTSGCQLEECVIKDGGVRLIIVTSRSEKISRSLQFKKKCQLLHSDSYDTILHASDDYIVKDGLTRLG